MRLILANTFGNADTLTVVLFVNPCTYNDRIRAAPAIFIFEEVRIFLCGKTLFKLLINTELSFGYTASTSENGVDNLLRKSKGRGLFFLCLKH